MSLISGKLMSRLEGYVNSGDSPTTPNDRLHLLDTCVLPQNCRVAIGSIIANLGLVEIIRHASPTKARCQILRRTTIGVGKTIDWIAKNQTQAALPLPYAKTETELFYGLLFSIV